MGNVDCAIHVRRAQGWEGVEWVVTKSKDDAEGQVVGFKIHIVELGLDADGDTVTSCAAEPFQPSEGERQALPPKKKGGRRNDGFRIAVEAFDEAIHKHGKAGRLKAEKFEEAFFSKYPGTPEAKRKAFGRQLVALVSEHVIEQDGDCFRYCPEKPEK